MNIGDNIRAARKALKMSQDDLAEAIGANRVTISHYEKGTYYPSISALNKLASVLNTTPNALIGEEEEPQDKAPKTIEAQTVSFAMDSLPKEQREMILNIVKAMFPNKPELFEQKGEDE